MTTLERVLEFLDRNHVCYAHTKHSLAFTALEVAFAEHISPHKLAKTVVYAGAQGYGLAVLPADCLIDMATLGAFVNDPFIRLASERELPELFPGCELGAMPPFGNLFNLPVIVDTSVDSMEFIAFSAGTHRDVIHMYTAYFDRKPSRDREGVLMSLRLTKDDEDAVWRAHFCVPRSHSCERPEIS